MADISNSREPLGFLSINTNGLGEIKKREAVFQWLKKFHNASSKIVFIQEAHSIEKTEPLWKKQWGNGKLIFSHGTSGSTGVVTILPSSINYELIETVRSQDGRYLALHLKVDSQPFCIINCHAPNTNKPTQQLAWLAKIQTILEKFNECNIVIGGDLNDCFIPHLDKYKCKPNVLPTTYVKAWNTTCDEFNLIDFWRVTNPNKKCYTWRQGSSAARLKQSRLDYWLVSTHLMYNLESVDIKTSIRSDHSLIDINFFKSDAPQRGPSFWRFNATLLKDNNYVEQIHKLITNTMAKYQLEEDKGLKWDLIKMELRSTTICFSKNKSKETRDNIKEAVLESEKLEKEISKDPTEETLRKYYENKSYIENYNNEKANGAILRSKASWAEFGEKNSKFFLNLEKRNYNTKCITKLTNELDSSDITDSDEILKYEETFYKKLYSNPPKNEEDLKKEETASNKFLDNTLPQISETDRNNCEKTISLEEIGIALRNLKNGKSPGSDGFTPDFYKFFWPKIKQVFFDSLNFAEENEKLSIDQRRGIINLIPKKNKDPRMLKNWRPISLLNTDYKIITKTLANRIKKVLPTVINPDQVAYLKDRFIGQNIRQIFDIMGYTKLMDKKGIIAFLDFEKAFDTIKWKVIYDALNAFNFGPKFISWVKAIYNESEACVTNNGFSSAFFKLQRGVRQGCPLSAYLFIVVVELLAHQIRIDKNIKGITIGTTEIKLVQMADDTTTFLEDEKSLENMLEILSTFEQFAGLKLNKTKTEAMWMGKNRNNQNTPLGINWVKQVNSLGIFFSYDTDYIMQKNFMDKEKDFKQILDMWMQRDLSLIGKITILKSLAFSKIIYQCGVITPPTTFIDNITKLAYNFVWHQKPNKIKRTTLIADYQDGGLKMLDLNSFIKAQKTMWVRRFLSSEKASWKALLELNLKDLLGPDTFKCRLDCKEKPLNFPNFYWEMMKAWFEVTEITNQIKTPMDIRRECMWLNEKIIVNKKQIKWNAWQSKGINIIHDILNTNGEFLTPTELKEKYQVKCDVLMYNKLKDAIPSRWRKIVKTMKVNSESINFKEQIHLNINTRPKHLNLVKNKDIYWLLVNKIKEKPIIIEKYKNELGIEENRWKQIFTIPRVLRDTKIRAFQYKLLYKLTPCNNYLKQIKKSDTDKCNWCNEIDDTVHFYAECNKLESFWGNFARWYAEATGKSISITLEDIIVGITTTEIYSECLNACLLLAKWHIYKNKLNQSETFFYRFLCELKYYINVEKSIALKNNRLQQFNEMWQKIEEHLT
jgi:exonuclease III